MNRFVDAIILPRETTAFERKYLKRINRIALWFFAGHLPVFTALAFFNNTQPLLAIALTLIALAGPLLANHTFTQPRAASHVHAFTAMIMGGLLVHFGQGPAQIEMHFYFFALLAMLALFANPSIIITAAATVIAHHVVMWLLLPMSVFNYAAPLWVVGVHAGFVVFESVAVCFIARSFHDNVIQLDKIVQERTRQLDARTDDMRLVLDNVAQGFVTLDHSGVMSPERSAIVAAWLGDAPASGRFADYLEQKIPGAGAMFGLNWDQLTDGLLPMKICMAQLLSDAEVGGKHLHFEYRPIGVQGDHFDKMLVVITDVTSEVERARLEIKRYELVHIVERILRDKEGFLEFYEESSELIANLTGASPLSAGVMGRIVHTLKGNAMVFGVNTIARLCHELETQMSDELEPTYKLQLARIAARWAELREDLRMLLDDTSHPTIEVSETEYQDFRRDLLSDMPRSVLADRVASWKLEPTVRRLDRMKDQATRIARRLDKKNIRVEVEDNGLRLERKRWAPFWSALIHVVRNALDHGFESAEERIAANKDACGVLRLSTRITADRFEVEVADDGSGIDWQRLAAQARAAGHEVDSDAALKEALFKEGVSTAQEVTEYSGRGVGMGAVRAACCALGGEVWVESSPTSGTKIAFRFPKEMMPHGHNEEQPAYPRTLPTRRSSSKTHRMSERSAPNA